MPEVSRPWGRDEKWQRVDDEREGRARPSRWKILVEEEEEEEEKRGVSF